MELFKRTDSNIWHFDFTVLGKRYRGSTKQRKRTAAEEFTARLFTEIAGGKPYAANKPPTLIDLSTRFLAFIENARLADKSKAYLRNGWRLLSQTDIAGMRIDKILAEHTNALRFTGGPYNTNCALKTLRRMLNLARKQWKLIQEIPVIALEKEPARELRLTEETEQRLLPFCSPLLRDVIILLRDTGMRPKKELFRMRVEHLDWANRMIHVPDSKTETGERYVPMSDRVAGILLTRVGGREDGWIFPAESASGHMTTIDKQWRKARADAKLPTELVMYCGRHDFGTEMMQRTGNLPLVMKAMGQRSVKAALKYQHPELEQIRLALNAKSMARFTTQ